MLHSFHLTYFILINLLYTHSNNSTGGNNNSPAAIAENAMRIATTGVGQLDIPTMKKYIQYCKAKCKPRLSDEAGDILASSYVKIRDDVRKRVMEVSENQLMYDITILIYIA